VSKYVKLYNKKCPFEYTVIKESHTILWEQYGGTFGKSSIMKEGCLFFIVLFVPMRSTKPGCFRLHSWSLWKALEERGAWAWFHGVWTCGAKVLEIE